MYREHKRVGERRREGGKEGRREEGKGMVELKEQNRLPVGDL